MSEIRLAIAGVGNCASAFIQGLYYYKNNKNTIGLIYPEMGGYKPSDIKVVAAFDVDERKVGKDLSQAIFEISRNEIVSLIGANGAGKSTLAHIISGVYPPTKGKIFFKGKEVHFFSPFKAREMGSEIVYKDSGVIGDRTVNQNIFLGRGKTHKLAKFMNILDKNFMRKEAVYLLNRQLNLNIPSVDQEAKFCSGGERHSIGISRAFYFNADLVVLDEPTTVLSVSAREVIYSFIKRLKTLGKGVLLISHEVDWVYKISDRFVILSKGEIIGNFNKNELSMKKLLKLLSA